MKIMAFGQPGWMEILLVLLLALLLFGAKRLPELARALGKSLSEFKRGKNEILKEMTDDEHLTGSAPDQKDESPPASKPGS